MSSRPTTQSSGLKAGGTNIIWNGKGTLNGITAISDGVNNATVTVFDNATTNTGTVLASVFVPATTAGTINILFDCAVRCDNGIVAQVSGTGATALIYFGAA